MSATSLSPQVWEEHPIPAPRTLEEAGLSSGSVEQILLKLLYFRGEQYGRQLAMAVGLQFSVIADLLETLKFQRIVEVKRSLGMGNVSAIFVLTEAGRGRAREYLEVNQYIGPAPVSLDRYTTVVSQQRRSSGWLTLAALRDAYHGMVLAPGVLDQIGPAIASGNSFLIYGKPGNGKTYMAEALTNLAGSVYVPYAIECQGQIIQVFDPILHKPLESLVEDSGVFMASDHDGRWVKCKRPFITSGGELSLEMLDLSYNSVSRIYEAPLQLKANNGIYLVDDFGRQKATPAEVLNRWIVPMERKIDFLSLQNGGKIKAPFEVFLIFSTNLKPEDLGDEAFLRRIQYKLLVRSPERDEYTEIFRRFCDQKSLACTAEVLEQFIDRYYGQTGRPFRRCQPRDLLTHALNLITFEDLEPALTSELLDRAHESCFVNNLHED